MSRRSRARAGGERRWRAWCGGAWRATWRGALGAAALVGCAHPQLPLPQAVAAREPPTLGTDDVFCLRVFGEPELSGTYRVGADGTISLPLAGAVTVAERTPAGAARAVEQALGGFLARPHASVFVKEFNSKKIYVFGQVRRPGTFAFTPGMNIVQAITLAGGFDRLADATGALVNRHADGHEARLKVSVKGIGEGARDNFLLAPGDIVYVPETYF